MPDSILQAIAYHCDPMEAPLQEIGTLTMIHLAYAFDYNDRNNVSLKDLISEESAINAKYTEGLGLQNDIANLSQVAVGV